MNRWAPAVSMLLVSLISYVDRGTLAILAPTILRETHLNNEQYGYFCFAGALALPAQTPTIDQSLSMKSLSGAQISPDGRYVAYTVQQANWDENEFATQVWIAVTATGERYQLTSGKKSGGGPQWAPDSRRLAFTSDRDGKRASSSIVDEMQNLFQVFPGFPLGVLIVSPQQV
jgi:hypothetical protein